MKQPPDTTMPEPNPTTHTTAHPRAADETVEPMGHRVQDVEKSAETTAAGLGRWAGALDRESARIARSGRWASVVVLEMVGPSTIVDWLESADAATAIPMLTETIHRHAREADVVVTLGPGRYGVLLVDTDQVLAINFVERVRTACDAWLARRTPDLRVAIGWADARPGRSIHEAQVDADEALERDRQATWAS